jgi:hypothetical protein
MYESYTMEKTKATCSALTLPKGMSVRTPLEDSHKKRYPEYGEDGRRGDFIELNRNDFGE